MSLMNLLAQKNDSCPLLEHSVWTERRTTRNVTVGVILLSEILLGALGNFYLLYHYIFIAHTEGRVRTMNFILMHLAVSNSLVILSKGLPKTMAALGLKNFVNDLVCHILLYIHRVARVVSFSIICLLCVFQAIMISPMDSCWKDLKVKTPQYVTVSLSLSWILFVFVNLCFTLNILNASSKWNLRNITQKLDLGFCHATVDEKISGLVYLALSVFPEVSFSVLIVWSNASMILFLHRHKQRVQHLHRSQVSSRSSAESIATQRILVLVSTIIYSHTLSSLFHMCVSQFNVEQEWLTNTADIISLCFPTVIPFLVVRHDSTVIQQTFAMKRSRKVYNHSQNS